MQSSMAIGRLTAISSILPISMPTGGARLAAIEIATTPDQTIRRDDAGASRLGFSAMLTLPVIRMVFEGHDVTGWGEPARSG